jgi:Flp pilus assembly protein TadG
MWDKSIQAGLRIRTTASRRLQLVGHAARQNRRKNERGGYLVEYALVFTISMTILLGVIGFGHALYAYHFVSHAAREGARYATVRGSTCGSDGSCATTNSASGTAGPTTKADVQTYVRNMAPPGINSTNVTVTACGVSGQKACAASLPTVCTAAVGGIPATPNYPGCTVQVQVQYTFNFIVPLISKTALTMTSSSDLVIVH